MSAPSVVERKSLVSSTIEALRAQISAHAWRTGDRIPPEAELAERFGVGRNTVREAIRVLSHSRMLEVRQGDGTYVRSEIDPAETLRSLSGVALTDHLELQRVLETEAARFAARRATASDIASMQTLLDARHPHSRGVVLAEQEMVKFLDGDGAFHQAVAIASHNEALQALYGHFVATIREQTQRILSAGGLPEPDVEAHQRIIDAIAAHDEEAAAAAAHAMLTPLIDSLRPPDR